MFRIKSIIPGLFLCLSVFGFSTVNAALTSPADGSTITSSPASINWSAGASEFWVRAYNNSTDVRIFDSGRLGSSTLSVSVPLPASITSLRIVFYEKVGGSWSSMVSVFSVDLDTMEPPPPGGPDLPDGNSPGDRLVWDGSTWQPEQPEVEVFPPDDNMMPFQNSAYVIKIRGPLPPNASGSTEADTPFVGQIIMWAGTYPPRGWAFADGQVVVQEDFPELYQVVGDNYGDVAEGLFKLPDLRGRVPVHFGSGPGLTNRIIGKQGGFEAVHNLEGSTASLEANQGTPARNN